MHNFPFGRNEILKVEVSLAPMGAADQILTFFKWARTPPSANWRFEGGPRPPPRGNRSPRRRSMSPRRGGGRGGGGSPRAKEEYRERDHDDRQNGNRHGDRSRSPDDRDRDMKDPKHDDDTREPEVATNGHDREGMLTW